MINISGLFYLISLIAHWNIASKAGSIVVVSSSQTKPLSGRTEWSTAGKAVREETRSLMNHNQPRNATEMCVKLETVPAYSPV